MIDIENITKSFGSLQVLKGIDLHVNNANGCITIFQDYTNND